jgi:hypothetical protein
MLKWLPGQRRRGGCESVSVYPAAAFTFIQRDVLALWYISYWVFPCTKSLLFCSSIFMSPVIESWQAHVIVLVTHIVLINGTIQPLCSHQILNL